MLAHSSSLAGNAHLLSNPDIEAQPRPSHLASLVEYWPIVALGFIGLLTVAWNAVLILGILYVIFG
jgi:hypothetical protein